MADKGTDLRVIRSKQLIEDALLALLEVKGIEGVTIKELTKKAGVNRGTFYLHYQDIYDLIEQLEKRMMEGLANISMYSNPEDLLNHNSDKEPYEPIAQAFTYMLENARFFKVMYNPKGLTMIGERFKSRMRMEAYAKVSKAKIVTTVLGVPLDYFIAFTSAAQFGVIQHWFETDMELSPREMALMLTRLTQHGSLQLAMNTKKN